MTTFVVNQKKKLHVSWNANLSSFIHLPPRRGRRNDEFMKPQTRFISKHFIALTYRRHSINLSFAFESRFNICFCPRFARVCMCLHPRCELRSNCKYSIKAILHLAKLYKALYSTIIYSLILSVCHTEFDD